MCRGRRPYEQIPLDEESCSEAGAGIGEGAAAIVRPWTGSSRDREMAEKIAAWEAWAGGAGEAGGACICSASERGGNVIVTAAAESAFRAADVT